MVDTLYEFDLNLVCILDLHTKLRRPFCLRLIDLFHGHIDQGVYFIKLFCQLQVVYL